MYVCQSAFYESFHCMVVYSASSTSGQCNRYTMLCNIASYLEAGYIQQLLKQGYILLKVR